VKLIKMFKRQHHQQIAYALRALDGPLLRENNCLFAGGTVMALRFGEYRESVDIDFLVADITGYRNLRQLLTGAKGIAAIVRKGVEPLIQQREIRADQYGIRTVLAVAGQPIKFKIVHEGRIELSPPEAGDEVCGIATLTPLDMAASKLLANSDRWADDGVFNRDVIDLAMMGPSLDLLRQAAAKAETAYGQAILRDLQKAIDRLQQRHDRLERCIEALAMTQPKALVWKNIRSLRRVIP
jgi:hypothetical protein